MWKKIVATQSEFALFKFWQQSQVSIEMVNFLHQPFILGNQRFDMQLSSPLNICFSLRWTFYCLFCVFFLRKKLYLIKN